MLANQSLSNYSLVCVCERFAHLTIYRRSVPTYIIMRPRHVSTETFYWSREERYLTRMISSVKVTATQCTAAVAVYTSYVTILAVGKEVFGKLISRPGRDRGNRERRARLADRSVYTHYTRARVPTGNDTAAT